MLLGGLGYFLTDFVFPNNVITFSGIFSNLALDFGLLIHLCFFVFYASKDEDTALLRAVRSRNEESVRLLLEKGAKVSHCDKVS